MCRALSYLRPNPFLQGSHLCFAPRYSVSFLPVLGAGVAVFAWDFPLADAFTALGLILFAGVFLRSDLLNVNVERSRVFPSKLLLVPAWAGTVPAGLGRIGRHRLAEIVVLAATASPILACDDGTGSVAPLLM